MKTLSIKIILIALLILTGCSDKKTSKRALTLYVSASLTDVIQEIGHAYEQDKDVEIVYNFASAGALAQQIMASPKADLFLSASQKWMNIVQKDGKIRDESRTTLLSNSLVVIENKNAKCQINNPIDLTIIPYKFLSVGDPASVPAGRYAKKWMETLPLSESQNVWDIVKNKISPLPDVRSALIQVEGNEDVIGIVYETDYISRKDKVNLLYKVPQETGPKIEYAVAILKASTSSMSDDFLEFLKSPCATEIFVKHGFTSKI